MAWSHVEKSKFATNFAQSGNISKEIDYKYVSLYNRFYTLRYIEISSMLMITWKLLKDNLMVRIIEFP